MWSEEMMPSDDDIDGTIRAVLDSLHLRFHILLYSQGIVCVLRMYDNLEIIRLICLSEKVNI